MTLVHPQSQIESGRKQQMSLLSIELSRERIRDIHRETEPRLEQDARRRIRLLRKTRRDAEATAIRMRHTF
jgi:hypothetical protein